MGTLRELHQLLSTETEKMWYFKGIFEQQFTVDLKKKAYLLKAVALCLLSGLNGGLPTGLTSGSTAATTLQGY